MVTPEHFTKWREAFGGRRFMITLGAGVVCTILRWFDRIDNTTFSTVVLGTVGIYIAGASYQKGKQIENPVAP
jgi:hypothetical protein